MDKNLITRCIISRNKELLKKVLNQNSYLGVMKYLIIRIKENLNNYDEEKPTITYNNHIINIFYDILHDFDDDVEELLIEINSFLSYLNKELKDLDTKSQQYHTFRHTQKRIKSYKELVLQYVMNSDKNCEYDFICYLIKEVRSFVYLEFIIKKNPSILSLKGTDVPVFEYLVKEYLKYLNLGCIEQNDLDFYRKSTNLFLENKKLFVEQDDLLIIDNIIKESLTTENEVVKKELIYLKQLINKFYPDLDPNNKIDIHSHIETHPSAPEYKKPINTFTRLDLRNLDTISIDMSIYKDNGDSILFDDAFTIFKHNKGHVVYIHLSDSPSFVFANKSLQEDVENRIFALRNEVGYIPLFNHEFASNYLSLAPNVDRFAFTVACEIDEFGKLVGVNFYESIIRNKKAFTTEEVDEILSSTDSPYKPLLTEYEILINNMLNRTDNIGYLIPATLNFLAGKAVGEYSNHFDIPTIYSNCVPFKNITNLDQCSLVDDFLSQNITLNYLDNFSEQIRHTHHTFFDTVNYGHCFLNAKSYCEISSPIRSYVSIAILQGLKKMLITQKVNDQIKEHFQYQYESLATRANAIDFVLRK